MKAPVDANKINELQFLWDSMADHMGNSHNKEPLAEKHDLNEYFDFLREVNPSKSVEEKRPEFGTEIFTL